MNFLFLALLVLCGAYALVFGGAPERWGAGLYMTACFSTYLVVAAPPSRFQSVEVGVFIVDAVVFLGFCALAVRAHRYWPIWVSALLGLGVLGHAAQWLGPTIIPWAYAVALSVWSYPILFILTLGTVAHRKRLERNGVDPTWLVCSNPSATKRRTGPTS